MIQGISHITLIVSDVERSAVFFQKVLDAKEVYDSGRETFSLSREKFLLIGGTWLCLMEGASLPEPTYHHIAFSVEEQDLEVYALRLQAAGAIIKKGRPRVNGEGHSLYFYDFDNHLFELHTGTLEERLKRYAKGKQPSAHDHVQGTISPTPEST